MGRGRGKKEIAERFKRHTSDNLLYRRHQENQHRQFTHVRCLQGGKLQVALYQKATFALNICLEITIVSSQVTMSLLLNNLESSIQLIRVTNADNLQNVTAI